MTDRFRPVRAGIIEVWDYNEQEFRFADGRLVLRGPNGSGKTKALELLVPFVLDGSIDARRLDPFSGKDRTMRSNLLYQGEKTRRGYCWLEFRKGGLAVTCGVGLQAQETRPQVRTWFFVTDRVVGDSLPLLDGDRIPMTRKAMRALLGDEQCFDGRDEHRRAVDRALFGFDGERYEAMLELVLTLRRPQLAKELDPDKLSDVLSQGLRTVDPELLRDSAQAFEDLEAVQRELGELARARRAVDELATTWRTYLRTRAARRLAELVERSRRVQDTEGELARLAAAIDERRGEVQAHTVRRDEARAAVGAAEAQKRALEARDAYQNRGQLEDKTRLVKGKGDERDRAGARAAAARERLAAEEGRLAAAAAEAQRAGERAADAFGELGARCRLADVHFVAPLDPAALRVELVAKAASVEAVLEVLVRLEAEQAELARREQRLQEEIARLEALGVRREEAAAALERAHAERLAAVATWFDELPAGLAGLLDRAALDEAATGGDLDVLGRVNEAWREPKERLIEARKAARDRAAERAERLADLDRTIDGIQSERDDAPPAPPTRGASREDRPGAPLWRLVRFRDEVPEAAQAGIEGALLSSGLLDAWLDPQAAELREDTWLAPGSPPPGVSLGTVLQAEDEQPVPASRVDAVLASIALDEGVVSVGRDGSFVLGPLRGSHRPERPRYIGATAREQHRRERVAALRAERQIVQGERDAALAREDATEQELQALERARSSVPGPKPVRTAQSALGRAEELLGAQEVVLASVRRERDEQARARDEASRGFRGAARQHGLRPDPEGLRSLKKATTEARQALERYEAAQERRDEKESQRRLASERAIGAREASEAAETEAQAAEAAWREEDAALSTLLETLGEEVRRVQELLDGVGARISEHRRIEESAEQRREAAKEALNKAEGKHEHAAEQLPLQRRDQQDAEQRLAPFARDALATVLEVAPGDEPFAGRLAAAVDGAAHTDERLKATETQLNNRLAGLDEALGSTFRHETRTDDGLTVVWLHDQLGEADVATFQRRVGERLDLLSDLLEERERAVFENQVLTSLVSRLRERLQETRELTGTMNRAMRERRLASGKGVGIRWHERPDTDPTRAELLQLLGFDAAFQSPERLSRMRELLRGEVKAERRDHPERTYLEILVRALDYRGWFRFELLLVEPDGKERRLSARVHGQLSGGEKAATVHLPLFAAAHAHFGAARPDCPRLIALDEAFAGIDETGTPELLQLAHAFDLDWFLTGHNLWVTEAFLPAVMHYDLAHDPVTRAVSAWPVLWNGRETVEGPDAEGPTGEPG